MARLTRYAGLGLLFVPAAAWSQDLTALVAFVAPPLLLAPLVVLVLRAKVLLPLNGTSASLASLVAFGVAELMLWLVIAGCIALIWFAERWAVLVIALLAFLGLVSTIRLVGAPHAALRFTVVMLLVFPAAWLLLQLLWYFGVLLLSPA